MEYIDLRKVGGEGLKEIRRQVVRLKKMGKTGKEISKRSSSMRRRSKEPSGFRRSESFSTSWMSWIRRKLVSLSSQKPPMDAERRRDHQVTPPSAVIVPYYLLPLCRKGFPICPYYAIRAHGGNLVSVTGYTETGAGVLGTRGYKHHGECVCPPDG